MGMPDKGLAAEAIFKELESFKADDLDWRSGKVMAYVFDPGPEVRAVIERAYTMYLVESGLDPTTYPSGLRMEREVVRIVADWLRGGPEVVGNFTSGGTESIMLAMKTARDWSREHRPQVTAPEIVVPRTAHAAFHKAGAYLGLKVVVSGVDPGTYAADVDSMRAAITPRTIALVGSAPNYSQAVVDPVPEIAALAREHGLLCHVDACVGGVMLSVLREAGDYTGPDFDFSVPGVTSVSCDLHKYGYCAKGASTVLYRDKELRRHQIFATAAPASYALVNNTILSSKTLGPLAAAWAVLQFLGREGYLAIFREKMAATRLLIEGVRSIPGLRVLGEPRLSMFAIGSDGMNLYQLADLMKKRGGWYLQPQFATDQTASNLHITVNRGTVAAVEPFLADLRACARELIDSPARIDPSVVAAQVRTLLSAMGPDAIEKLSAMAGVQDSQIPGDMAMINTILDAMPDEVTEQMLIRFMNDMFV